MNITLIEILIPFCFILGFLFITNQYFMKFRDFMFKLFGNRKLQLIILPICLLVIVVAGFHIYFQSGTPTSSGSGSNDFNNYLSGIIPVIFMFAGAIMNYLVLFFNKGKMPVYIGKYILSIGDLFVIYGIGLFLLNLVSLI